MLRTITVCQNAGCQQRGSKSVLYWFEKMHEEQYKKNYPTLKIEAGDCGGDCELGPIVRVNDSVVLRYVDKDQVEELMAHPETMLGEVMHVLEKDRETFDRIIKGELF
jgi:NADH:ubiquinone oxidoreductase subunit E